MSKTIDVMPSSKEKNCLDENDDSQTGFNNSYLYLLLLVIISVVTYPREGLTVSDEVTLGKVWYFGWITAVCTGLGAVPLLFLKKPNDYIFGAASAVAAGMMMSASFGLLSQGVIESGSDTSKMFSTFCGVFIGWLFLQVAKKCLDKYNISVGFKDVSKKSLKKLMLVVIVMTLHSFSEGVAIGVSFAGENSLGLFISCSLAVHNIPEGLAIALVMMPCGVSFLDTFLWAIFTSLPQPLVAVPAFMFVETFEPLLIIGLGFAGGAMLFVALMELIPDAREKLPVEAAIAVTTLSFGIMTLIQWEAANII